MRKLVCHCSQSQPHRLYGVVYYVASPPSCIVRIGPLDSDSLVERELLNWNEGLEKLLSLSETPRLFDNYGS